MSTPCCDLQACPRSEMKPDRPLEPPSRKEVGDRKDVTERYLALEFDEAIAHEPDCSRPEGSLGCFSEVTGEKRVQLGFGDRDFASASAGSARPTGDLVDLLLATHAVLGCS